MASLVNGGSVRIDEERIFLEPTGNFESISEIENSIITLPGQSEPVYLKDLVTIQRAYADPPESQMFTSGEPSLGLAISKREDGNIITLGESVKQVVRRLQSVYPIGIEFEIVAFEPGVVQRTISDFTGNLVQSIVVVMLSMILFLGLRTGIVVATLIPSTILATFLVMGYFDIGLNQISLAALIISLGLLVDNAIVMSESCLVLMAQGKKPIDAAINSAKELKVPLLTSSLTTAAAFLPIYLAESATGEYTAALFQVVSIALLCSWLMALTLIPLLCAMFLRVEEKEGNPYASRFYRIYRKILILFLRRPVFSVLFVVGFFFFSLQGFQYVPKSFFPSSDDPMFTVKMKLSSGTSIEETANTVRRLEKFMKEELGQTADREGITNWTSYVGGNVPRFVLSYNPDPPTPEQADMIINVSDHRIMPELIARLGDYCPGTFPRCQGQCPATGQGSDRRQPDRDPGTRP